jgi:hypothetical protein
MAIKGVVLNNISAAPKKDIQNCNIIILIIIELLDNLSAISVFLICANKLFSSLLPKNNISAVL